MNLSELEVLNLHASGGMAEVYRARVKGDDGSERHYAVKKILPHFTRDKEILRMFVEEARIAACLDHDNVVRVYDLCTSDSGEYFIVMEFADGKDMSDIIWEAAQKKARIPVGMALQAARDVLRALEYAWTAVDGAGVQLKLIHRDISPHNVLVTWDGSIKLTDFGIAKVQASANKTQMGIIKGKFGYMSPEQARGRPLDQRSDLFNVGILLFESFTGDRLFAGQTDIETLELMRVARIPRLDQKLGIPAPLEAIMRRALERDPAQRPQTPAAFERELMDVVEQCGIALRPTEIVQTMATLFPQLAAAAPVVRGTRQLELKSQLWQQPVIQGGSVIQAGSARAAPLPPKKASPRGNDGARAAIEDSSTSLQMSPRVKGPAAIKAGGGARSLDDIASVVSLRPARKSDLDFEEEFARQPEVSVPDKRSPPHWGDPLKAASSSGPAEVRPLKSAPVPTPRPLPSPLVAEPLALPPRPSPVLPAVPAAPTPPIQPRLSSSSPPSPVPQWQPPSPPVAWQPESTPQAPWQPAPDPPPPPRPWQPAPDPPPPARPWQPAPDPPAPQPWQPASDPPPAAQPRQAAPQWQPAPAPQPWQPAGQQPWQPPFAPSVAPAWQPPQPQPEPEWQPVSAAQPWPPPVGVPPPRPMGLAVAALEPPPPLVVPVGAEWDLHADLYSNQAAEPPPPPPRAGFAERWLPVRVRIAGFVAAAVAACLGFGLVGMLPSLLGEGHRPRTLLLRTSPPGASVTLDDVKLDGVTPLIVDIDLDDGPHAVRVALGAASAQHKLQLSGDDRFVLVSESLQSTGSIRVETRPVGAQVLLDGLDVGVAPLTLAAVGTDKPHVVEARKPGFLGNTAGVPMERPANHAIVLVLQPIGPLGRVVIASALPATLTLDGAPWGTTSLAERDCAPGRHDIVARIAELGIETRTSVEVPERGVARYFVSFD